MAGHDDDLPYRVEVWDDKDTRIEEIIALTSDYATAKGAYEAAVKRRPGRFITLREKARQPRLATGRVNSLRGQFKRFHWRQWLRHDCCLMMPPTPSEAGGDRNKSGADDKDAHGLGSLFCAPELRFLINHSQPNSFRPFRGPFSFGELNAEMAK